MYYLFYKVNGADIFMLKNILESYEHMMDMTTIDRTLPKIQVSIATDFKTDAESILADLGTRFLMIPLHEPANVSQGNY